MNVEEKQSLLKATSKEGIAGETPSNDHSIIPLTQEENQGVLAQDEIEDNTEYNWDDFDDYKIPTNSEQDPRDLGEIASINKITRYYTKYLIEQKKDLKDKDELKGIENMLKHQKLFADGKFSWEVALPDMDPILSFAKTTISKFSSVFDFEMLDHNLFQKIFPVKMIDQYLSVVNRQYGKPVYDKALRFHTNLLEIFLWHHLNADTRFHPKITTVDINVIDPFLRIKIRERNRADPMIKEKYYNSMFDLKKFIYMLLELYFPNVTWRYIGGGHRLHPLDY
jgi:hypothetical protein